MPNDLAQHLVTVWNPRYAADAMEAHLRLLLEWDARATREGTGYDDVYVWWGKVRSNQRQQPMPHLADIIALGADSGDHDGDQETHLYLTDYQSLYLAGVTAELARVRNARYADRPVSLYGGMVDLPLLVSRPDGRRYFDERDRELFADGQL